MSIVSLLASPMTMAAFPTMVKSVGSSFRYGIDYHDAPPDIKHNALKRESSLLGLTFLSNLAVQKLGSKTIPELMKAVAPGLMKEGPAGEAAVMLARLFLTIPGNILAEGLSRMIGKPPNWKETMKPAFDHTPEPAFQEPVRNPFAKQPTALPEPVRNPFALSAPFA